MKKEAGDEVLIIDVDRQMKFRIDFIVMSRGFASKPNGKIALSKLRELVESDTKAPSRTEKVIEAVRTSPYAHRIDWAR